METTKKELTAPHRAVQNIISRRELVAKLSAKYSAVVAAPLSACTPLFGPTYNFALEFRAIISGIVLTSSSVVSISFIRLPWDHDAWNVRLTGWAPFIHVGARSGLGCMLTPAMIPVVGPIPLHIIDIPFFLGTGINWSGRDGDFAIKEGRRGYEILDRFWRMQQARDVPSNLLPQFAYMPDICKSSCIILDLGIAHKDVEFSISSLGLRIVRTRVRQTIPGKEEVLIATRLSGIDAYGTLNDDLPLNSIRHEGEYG